MRLWLADCRKLLRVLVWGTALGCGDQGPPPTIHLSIQGQILSTDATPVPIAGAGVALAYWDSIGTKIQRVADQDGRYQLDYPITTSCLSPLGYLLQVTAKGYEQKSTLSFQGGLSFDPPIQCTSEPQTINLALNPLGYVHLTTHTTGPDWDPAGYVPALTGKFTSDGPDETSLGYPMPVNAEQIIPLLPGIFKLELAEVVQNCTVGGDNPRTITVTARDTVVSVFDVTCVAR